MRICYSQRAEHNFILKKLKMKNWVPFPEFGVPIANSIAQLGPILTIQLGDNSLEIEINCRDCRPHLPPPAPGPAGRRDRTRCHLAKRKRKRSRRTSLFVVTLDDYPE